MAIYETGGHGEPHELIVECRESVCINFRTGFLMYHMGHCNKPKDIIITYGGQCNQFKEKESQNG